MFTGATEKSQHSHIYLSVVAGASFVNENDKAYSLTIKMLSAEYIRSNMNKAMLLP